MIRTLWDQLHAHGQRLSANEAPPPMMMSVRSPQDSDLHGFLEIQNIFPPMFWFHRILFLTLIDRSVYLNF